MSLPLIYNYIQISFNDATLMQSIGDIFCLLLKFKTFNFFVNRSSMIKGMKRMVVMYHSYHDSNQVCSSLFREKVYMLWIGIEVSVKFIFPLPVPGSVVLNEWAQQTININI